MDRKLEELLNAYKNDIRKYIRTHPLSLLDKGISGIRSFIFYGHDQILLDIYVDTFICRLCNIEHSNLVRKKHELYTYSDYHFEIDLSSDQRTELLNFIKHLKRTPSMTGKPHIIHIKNITNIICRQLHHILDIMNHNIVIMVSTPSLMNVNDVLKSRSEIVNLTPMKDQCMNIISHVMNVNDIYVETNVFDKLYTSSNGNMIQILLRMFTPDFTTNIETNIITSINDMLKMRSFLTLITKIRDLTQKIYHINAPFKYIAKVIIQKYHNHSNIHDIIQLCACTEHEILLAYKELFVYEKFFIELIEIIKNKEKLKETKKKALKDL